MHFGLLGFDHDLDELVRFIHGAEEHELQLACCGRLDAVPNGVRTTDRWEDLLTEGRLDAVLVGDPRPLETDSEPLRQLVQAGIPLLLTYAACPAIVAYELEMLRQDVEGVLLPLAPGRLHPAWTTLTAWRHQPAASPNGSWEQLVLHRALSSRNRGDVLTQLAKDVGMLRAVCGDVGDVSAIGPLVGDTFQSCSVHLGAGATDVLWSLQPQETTSRLEIVGNQGTSTLALGSPDPWRLQSATGQETVWSDWNEPAAWIENVRRAEPGHATSPDWSDLCRDWEIVEAAEISLRRKRTIDAHPAERSEEKTFKSLMAAGGCVILMLIVVVLLLWSMVEGLRMPLIEGTDDLAHDQPAERPHLLIRLWPVYPLLLFLALQGFLIFTRRRSPDTSRT